MPHATTLSVRMDAQLYQRVRDVCSTHGIRPRAFLEEAVQRTLKEFLHAPDGSGPRVDLSAYREAYADHLQHAARYGSEDAVVAAAAMAGLRPFLEATNERS